MEKREVVKVILADDHQLLLEGLTKMFHETEGMEVISTASNGDEVLNLLEKFDVDLVLLDINMPGKNGVETARLVTKKYPHVKIIALSMYKRSSYIVRMMQNGASGYLLKNDSHEEIKQAILHVMNGGRYFSSKIDVSLMMQHRDAPGYRDWVLSDREKEVLGHIAHGHTNAEIAEKLYISPHTIDSHRKNIQSKLLAKNTADMVRIAVEKGLI